MMKHIEIGVLLVLICFFFQGIVNYIYPFENRVGQTEILSHQSMYCCVLVLLLFCFFPQIQIQQLNNGHFALCSLIIHNRPFHSD